MVKQIKRLTTDKMKELDGFEDVLDLFPGTEFREGSIDPRSGDDTFELYHFLENENRRLHLLDQLYSSKVKTLKRHPQTALLIDELLPKRESVLTQLIAAVASHDSPFHAELERVFNKAYKPAETTTESDD